MGWAWGKAMSPGPNSALPAGRAWGANGAVQEPGDAWDRLFKKQQIWGQRFVGRL